MKTKINCTLHKYANAQGLHNITIYFRINGKQIEMRPGISCKDGELIGSSITVRSKNLALASFIANVENKLSELESSGKLNGMSPSDIRDYINGVEKVDESKFLFPYFSDYISKKSKRSSELYSATLTKIQGYIKEKGYTDSISFDDITVSWLSGFDQYMAHTMSVNTRAIHMRNLRAVINAAITDDRTSNYPFRKFTIKREEADKKALTVSQLREIRDMKINPNQVKARDVFMLSFYLRGINVVDLFTATNLVEDRLIGERAKTAVKYSIKVEPEAYAIINRYPGKNYLIDVCDNSSSYRNYYTRFNAIIKSFGAKFDLSKKRIIGCSKYDYLTSYHARDTWATIAASLGGRIELIGEGLAHKNKSITESYITRHNEDIDELNRLVIDFVNSDFSTAKEFLKYKEDQKIQEQLKLLMGQINIT